jgi:NADH-quinone oxidoreductase subunit E
MSDATIERTVPFEQNLAKVKPEAERLLSLYPQPRSALIPLLHAFQDVEGWVSPEALAQIAEWVGVPLSTVESTASFYTLIYRRPVGKYMVQVCRNLSCIINGAGEVMEHCRRELGVGHLQTTADGLISYEEVECLAACDRAPCAQINLEFVYDLTTEKVDAMLAAMRAGTYEIAAAPQSAKPAGDWHVGQEPAHRSPGAQEVATPNTPGGLGDASGVSMIERLQKDPYPITVRPTQERLVREGAARLDVAPPSSNGHAH